MKNLKISALSFFCTIACITFGCDNLLVKNSKFACNYSFIKCENSKVEKKYKNQTARIKKITDSNNFPPPYNHEFYLIDLDPNNESAIESYKTLVIPCGDLPADLRKDGLLVKVTGDQMSCTIVPRDYPDRRHIGNSLFNITSVKPI